MPNKEEGIFETIKVVNIVLFFISITSFKNGIATSFISLAILKFKLEI